MAQTAEDRSAYLKEYFKKRRIKNIEAGMCVSCTKEPAVSGRTSCQRCLDDKKLCQKFGTAGPHRQIYADLFEAQQGLCAICHKQMLRPVLDHSHATMEVRGLLCSRCNVGLGQFQDDPEILTSALKYITTNAGIGVSLKKRENAGL